MNTNDIERLIQATAYDRDGEKIGSIGQVYLDDQSGQPSWITVNTGLFGMSESLVPLEGAEFQEEDHLVVAYPKDVVKDAPNIEGEEHITPAEEDELFSYYSGHGYNAVTDGHHEDLAAGSEHDHDQESHQETSQDLGDDQSHTVDQDRDLNQDLAYDQDRSREADGVATGVAADQGAGTDTGLAADYARRDAHAESEVDRDHLTPDANQADDSHATHLGDNETAHNIEHGEFTDNQAQREDLSGQGTHIENLSDQETHIENLSDQGTHIENLSDQETHIENLSDQEIHSESTDRVEGDQPLGGVQVPGEGHDIAGQDLNVAGTRRGRLRKHIVREHVVYEDVEPADGGEGQA